MDEEMDAAIKRGKDLTERSSDELAGRVELVVTVSLRGRMSGEPRTFRAYVDDTDAVGKLDGEVHSEIVAVVEGR